MTRTSIIPASGAVVAETISAFRYARVNSATNPFQISLDSNTWNDASANSAFGPLGNLVTGYGKGGGGTRVELPTRYYLRAVGGLASTVLIEYGPNPLPAFYVGNPSVDVNTTLAATAVATSQFLKSVAAAGTPVVLGAANFQTAKIIAQKTIAGAANTGNVRIGAGVAAGQQPFSLAPGDEITIEAPANKYRSFADWYVDADNNGDGIVVIYS